MNLRERIKEIRSEDRYAEAVMEAERPVGRPRVFERELRVNFTKEQIEYLEREAHRLGLYLTDVVRAAVADKLQAAK